MNLVVRSILVGLLTLLAGCSSGLEEPVFITPQETSTTLSIPVISASDDAEEIQGGAMQLTGGLLDLRAKDGVLQTIGVRFQNIAIPRGATIESAYFTVKGGDADSGSVTLKVQGEATDNALTFSTAQSNISSRSKTSAAVTWQPNSWTAGKPYQTGNIASIVQEVVNRSGWQSGNALALFVSGVGGTAERAAIAYGSDASRVPVLVITFRGGTTQPPTPDPEPEPEPEPGTTNVSLKVSSAGDDLEELSSGTVTTGMALDFNQSQKVGVRFNSVSIPQGATITSASLSLSALASDASSLSLSIKAQAADSAPTLGTSARNLSSRPVTTASATWQVSAWTAGMSYRSAELKSVVQEVVSRSGWQSGNALALVISGSGSGKRAAAAWDKDANRASQLTLNYTVPTPEPEPEPEPEPNPSVEQQVWLARLKKTITNPKYDQHNGWMNPATQASSGDLYKLGRNLNMYITGLILAHRETGDPALIRQIDTIMNIAKSKLADPDGDGYQNWLYLNANGDSTTRPFVNTDKIELDEMLTHSLIAAVAYTLEQAGYTSSASFWTDYLQNDFEAKWRKRSGKATGYPFIKHSLMHPMSEFIRYHYYMYKLTGRSDYLTEARRLAAAVTSTIRPDGTWSHFVGRTTDCQPTTYIVLTTQALADLATNGSGLVDAATMERAASAVANKVLLNLDATIMANNICGTGTFGTVWYFASYPYSVLARWDDSGRLRLATERVYATTEKGRMDSPRIYNLPAVMTFTLGN